MTQLLIAFITGMIDTLTLLLASLSTLLYFLVVFRQTKVPPRLLFFLFLVTDAHADLNLEYVMLWLFCRGKVVMSKRREVLMPSRANSPLEIY